jgi:hypothetical protein
VIGSLDPRRIFHLNGYTLARLAATRPQAVRLFDLFAKSCPRRSFSDTIPGSRLRLRRDGSHYTPWRAAWIAQDLGPLVVEEAHRHDRHEPSGR